MLTRVVLEANERGHVAQWLGATCPSFGWLIYAL
jgi:hypothetical protein